MKVKDLHELMATVHKKAPFAVMTQVVMRGVIGQDFNRVFEECRSTQYERVATFEQIATAVADVVLKFSENPNQAYAAHKESLGISLDSFYAKLKCTELATSEGIVRMSAERSRALQDELSFVPWEILSGYQVKSVDGNHLQATDKRQKVLWNTIDRPLPGTAVAVFDHQRRLFEEVYLLEDAHAQECSLCDRIVADLKPNDLLLGDRHFCVLEFLQGIADAEAFFVIRHHGRFKGKLVGKRRKIGETDRGMVYEQEIRTKDGKQTMRRITIDLNKATEDGEWQVHLLSNLPPEIDALVISNLYLIRWEVERGFYYVTTSLTCEVKTISHPRAALFLFSMALLAYNVRQILFAAHYAENDETAVNELSHFKIATEVARHTPGLLTAIPEQDWDRYIPKTLPEIATLLRQLAGAIDLKKYARARRGPKKPKPKPTPRSRRRTHASTGRMLALAKQAKRTKPARAKAAQAKKKPTKTATIKRP